MNDRENEPADVGGKADRDPRIVLGWALTVIGFVAMAAGVLHLTSATIGGPIHEFKDRRTYTEVKRAAHRALPVTLLLGLSGLGLVVGGGRIRASGRRPPTAG